MIDFQNTLGPWMGRTMKLMDFYFQDSFKNNDIDLSKNQWIILKVLSENDGQVQNDLAFVTKRDKTSLTRLLSGMERKNLVARIPSKTDKRINHIYITKSGSKIFQKTLPVVQKVISEIQESLSEEEIKRTIETLQKIQINLITKIEGCDTN